MDGILDRLFPASPMMGLLGQDQQQMALEQARQQGLLGLAAGLLQAGGPSRTRTNIGQAIGAGLMSGQQMYQQALDRQLQGQLTMEKVGEARRLREQQALARQLMPQLVTTERQQALTAGGADPLAAVIRSAEAGTLNQPTINQAAANTLRSLLPPADFAKVMDAIKTQFELGKPPEPKTITLGEGQQAFAVGPGGVATQIAAGAPKVEKPTGLTGEYSNIALSKFGTADLRQLTPEQLQQLPGLVEAQKRAVAEAGRTVIDMTGGQKGFENETNLRKEFQGLPETKAFGEMKSAYGQVLEGLNKANAVGDLAAATKIMKLLDPGSVVRESELAMAMQAGGLMDRVTNYATNIMQGTKLSPAQRKDFADLAKSLFSVSFDAFGEKRNQYRSLADQYGFNVNRVVGPEPELPAPKATGATASDLQKAARAEMERRRRGQ